LIVKNVPVMRGDVSKPTTEVIKFGTPSTPAPEAQAPKAGGGEAAVEPARSVGQVQEDAAKRQRRQVVEARLKQGQEVGDSLSEFPDLRAKYAAERAAASGPPTSKPGIFANAPDEVQQALARIKNAAKSNKGAVVPTGGDFDPVQLAKDVHTVGKHVFDQGVKQVEEWKNALVDAMGEHVKPYLDDAWKALNPSKSKTEVMAGRTTSVQNAVSQAEAEMYGLSEVQREAKKTNIQAFKDAAAVIKEDSSRGRALTQELIDKPRVATGAEVHVLDLDRMRIQNAYLDAPAGAAKEALFKEYQDNQLAASRAKQHASAAFSAFKSLVKEDYSLSAMELRKHAELDRPLTEAERTQVKADVEKYANLQKLYDEHQAQYAADREKWNAERKAWESKRKPSESRVIKDSADFKSHAWGSDNKVFTTSARDAARARLLEKGTRLNAGIDPTMVADLAVEIGYHVEAGVRFSYKAMHSYLKSEYKANDEEIRKAYIEATNDKRLASSKERSQTQLEDLKKGIPPQPKAPGIVYDREAMRLRDEVSQAKATLDAYGTKPKRDLFDLVTNTQREFILSSPPVVAKLIVYDIYHAVTEGISDIAAPVVGRLKVPGEGGVKVRVRDVPGVVEGAPYADIIRGNIKGYQRVFSKQQLKDIAETAKTGTAIIGRIRGDKPGPAEFGGIIGRALHGTVKSIVQRFAFERALEIQIRQAKRLGIDYTDPAWQEQAQFNAAMEGNRAQLQNKNKAGDALSGAIAGVARAGTGGRIAATGLKLLMPIRNIPMNIVGRTIQTSPIGTAEGIYRQIRMSEVYKKTGEAPTVEEIGKMARAYRYGGLGALAALLGITQPSWFKSSGNNWKDPNKDNKGEKMETGSFQIFGVHIPKNEAHHSFLESVNTWATIGQEYRKTAGKNNQSKVNAMLDTFIDSGSALAEDLPGVVTANMMGKAPSGRAKVGVVASSVLVPGAVKYAAKLSDKTVTMRDAGLLGWMQAPVQSRKPQGFTDEIKYGIPGLRQQIGKNPKAAIEDLRAEMAAHPKGSLPPDVRAHVKQAVDAGLITFKGATEMLAHTRYTPKKKAYEQARAEAKIAKQKAHGY
jgi:hypothetical protein